MARKRSNTPSMRPAANFTASSINLSPEPASYPQISQTRQIQRLGLRSADQLLKNRRRGAELLPASLQNAHENALGMCSARSSIAAPDFTSHHHRADGLFGSPVRGFQAGTTQERK